MRQMWMALALLAFAVFLSAAATDPGLPSNFWNSPAAAVVEPHHNWSDLEHDLRPEACAQCHNEQFESWKGSLHAHAFSPGLAGQFPSMGYAEANSCLKCHAPLTEQKYRNENEVDLSLQLLIKYKKGFDSNADIDAVKLPLRHSGVNCAACHVRRGKRFGPPPKASAATGHLKGDVHGGFMATRAFEASQFCTSCHQFPQSMAINGKPLENTFNEWKESDFSKKNISCQSCHMPGRKHLFKGIHDSEMVKKGLRFDLKQQQGAVQLSITSIWIGHAFPTYVTPKVVVSAEAEDRTGKLLKQWQWEIVREVYYANGWQERRDTRLMPGERREFIADALPDTATAIRFSVRVIPDQFYKGVYDSFLARVRGDEQHLFLQARAEAEKRDYLVYQKHLLLHEQD